MKSVCSVDGCLRNVHGKGYCKNHYYSFKKYGDPLLLKLSNHGMRNSAEYRTWCAMKQRCQNKNHEHYKEYGGRGITVNEVWALSFQSFIEDMGRKPFPKAQLDRIDNNQGYTKKNCRWVTAAENGHNKRNNIFSWAEVREIREDYRVKGLSVRSISEKYGVSRQNIYGIVQNKTWKELGVLCGQSIL